MYGMIHVSLFAMLPGIPLFAQSGIFCLMLWYTQAGKGLVLSQPMHPQIQRMSHDLHATALRYLKKKLNAIGVKRNVNGQKHW